MPPIGAKRKPLTIGVVGSRDRDRMTDYRATKFAIKSVWKPGDRLVSGGAEQGADNFAYFIADELGCTITIHFPRGGMSSPAKYHVRNRLIAADADILIALLSPLRKGGTDVTVAEAKRLGKRIILV